MSDVKLGGHLDGWTIHRYILSGLSQPVLVKDNTYKFFNYSLFVNNRINRPVKDNEIDKWMIKMLI